MKYAYFEVSIVLDVKLFGDDVVTLHAGHSHKMFRDMHRRDMYLNYYLIFNIIGCQREKKSETGLRPLLLHSILLLNNLKWYDTSRM